MSIDFDDVEDAKEKMSEKATTKPTTTAHSKSSKKEHTTSAAIMKRGGSATKIMAEPDADRSKVTETNNSIERIALFGEGSETGGAKFQPIEISQAQ